MSVSFDQKFQGAPADVAAQIAASKLPDDLKAYLTSIAGNMGPNKEGGISIDVAGHEGTADNPGDTRIDRLIAH